MSARRRAGPGPARRPPAARSRTTSSTSSPRRRSGPRWSARPSRCRGCSPGRARCRSRPRWPCGCTGRPWEAFLHPSPDEFGHIHRAGFLHLTVPPPLVAALTGGGWAERHPISLRPQWPDTIVMLYAPRDEAELAVAVAVLRASWRQASVSPDEKE
ncbi:luciferase family protein [Actinomadura namibiensis]|uniref:luciferase domain-containing protein n=1 Tax=Actinomadura kijaniata TaxID=46161 RepID=UPI003618F94E